jgi:hypothetical protein
MSEREVEGGGAAVAVLEELRAQDAAEKAKAAQARQRYRAMVVDFARDRLPPAERAGKIARDVLAAAGKSTEDLARDVEAMRRRLPLVALAASLPARLADMKAATVARGELARVRQALREVLAGDGRVRPVGSSMPIDEFLAALASVEANRTNAHAAVVEAKRARDELLAPLYQDEDARAVQTRHAEAGALVRTLELRERDLARRVADHEQSVAQLRRALAGRNVVERTASLMAEAVGFQDERLVEAEHVLEVARGELASLREQLAAARVEAAAAEAAWQALVDRALAVE